MDGLAKLANTISRVMECDQKNSFVTAAKNAIPGASAVEAVSRQAGRFHVQHVGVKRRPLSTSSAISISAAVVTIISAAIAGVAYKHRCKRVAKVAIVIATVASAITLKTFFE